MVASGCVSLIAGFEPTADRTVPSLTGVAASLCLALIVRVPRAITRLVSPTLTARVGVLVAYELKLETLTNPPLVEFAFASASVVWTPWTRMLPLLLTMLVADPKLTVRVGAAKALAVRPLASTRPPPNELSDESAVV